MIGVVIPLKKRIDSLSLTLELEGPSLTTGLPAACDVGRASHAAGRKFRQWVSTG